MYVCLYNLLQKTSDYIMMTVSPVKKARVHLVDTSRTVPVCNMMPLAINVHRITGYNITVILYVEQLQLTAISVHLSLNKTLYSIKCFINCVFLFPFISVGFFKVSDRFILQSRCTEQQQQRLFGAIIAG